MKFTNYFYVLFFMVREPLVGQGLLIIEASGSHTDTPHSVGLLWTSDRPVADLLLTHSTHKRQTSMFSSEIWTHSPSKQASADPRLRRRDNRDRLCKCIMCVCVCVCVYICIYICIYIYIYIMNAI